MKPRKTRGIDRKMSVTVAKRVEALDLRIQGYSLRAIAREMRLSGPQAASDLLSGAFKDVQSPKVEELRAEVEERSRTLLEQLMPIVVGMKGAFEDRLDAIDRVVKIDRELRQLHGLDAPSKTEVTGKLVTFDMSKLTDEQLDRLAGGDVSVLRDWAPGGAPSPGEGGETPT